MLICCLGDSLTKGDYGVKGMSGVANVKEENYPYFLAKLLNCETKNYGYCGIKPEQYLWAYKDGSIDVSKADVIIVMLGTNGGLSAEDETQNNIAFKELIQCIKFDAPNAKVYICTPPFATENPEYSNFGYAPRVKEATRFIKKFCNENGYNIIDVNACKDFCEENVDILQSNDGLHMSKTGYKTLAKFIAEHIHI